MEQSSEDDSMDDESQRSDADEARPSTTTSMHLNPGPQGGETTSRTTVLPPVPESSSVEFTKSPPPQSPARRIELLGIIGLVILADGLLYRRATFTSIAAFLLGAMPLFLLTRPRDAGGARPLWTFAMGGLLTLIAIKLVWLGHPALALIGGLVLAGWTLTVCGRPPFVIDTFVHATLAPLAGLLSLPSYRFLLGSGQVTAAREHAAKRPKAIVLPVIVTGVFGLFFILANPDLSEAIRSFLTSLSSRFSDWVSFIVPDAGQAVFWVFIAWVAIGLVRPVVRDSILAAAEQAEQRERADSAAESSEAHMFRSFANTLMCVTVLFAFYLVFEFITLGRRDFPEGFYYAGYAHAGAAWLTVALATASALLSAMFRGSTLRDPRLPTLKKLAWVWSAENFLLAIAVINRLLIYVDFNGMTRMRTIGFLGVAAVFGGLILVVIKIKQNRGFVWLVRGDLLVLAAAVTTYFLLPVDRLVHSYNTSRVLAGHLAPSVQITAHPHDIGGATSIIPLINCDDAIIADGVAAHLAMLADEVRHRVGRQQRAGWTAYQHADRRFLAVYEALPEDSRLDGESDLDSKWQAFKKYAYEQWY